MARAHSFRKKLLIWPLAGLAFLFLLICLIVGGLRFINPPVTAFMLADQEEFPDRRQRQRWVTLKDISPWMPLAVIASEDQRFLDHWGVDFNALGDAINEFRKGQGLRGASTITQQTVKNLFLWNGRDFSRKALEAGLALLADGLWSKSRTMELYLNVAEFGPGIYGVEAASRFYFGIPASRLTAEQAARLAAVLPSPKKISPTASSDYVTERVAWITKYMKLLGGLNLVRSRLYDR